MSMGLLADTFAHRVTLGKLKPRRNCLNIFPFTRADPLGMLITLFAILESYEPNLPIHVPCLSEALSKTNKTIFNAKGQLITNGTSEVNYPTTQYAEAIETTGRALLAMLNKNEDD